MKKVGIYVQVPFCQTKCTYCNFHTGVVASSTFAPYVEAVCGEIRRHRELLTVAGGGMARWGDIYRAVPILREAGIGNVSFDLIAGLPHQTKESWRQSLEELAALAPEHVSVYLLEIDEGSRLGKELLQGGVKYSAGAVPNEGEMADFYDVG